MPYGKGTYGSKVGRPRKRVKGGQRLMQLSKAGLKRRQARVGGKKYVTPLPKKKVAKKVVAKAAPKKAAPKSTVGGRNKTAMRTPKGTTIPKKAVRKSDANKYKGPERFRATPVKKKATPVKKKTAPKRKSDAGQYKGPERFRATPKKKVATKPTGKKRTYLDDMPADMKSPAGTNWGELPVAAVETALIADYVRTRGRSPRGKKALKGVMARLGKGPLGRLFKGKSKVKKPTRAEMEKTKNTEEGYKKFEADRKARSRKRKPKS